MELSESLYSSMCVLNTEAKMSPQIYIPAERILGSTLAGLLYGNNVCIDRSPMLIY